jgi:hypothetical protein
VPIRILSVALSLLATIGMTRFRYAVSSRSSEQGSQPSMATPSLQRLNMTSTVLVGFASSLGYTAALWQHVSAASTASLVERLGQGLVSVHVGTGATVLTWASCLLLSTTLIGCIFTAVAIYVNDL